MTGNSGKSLPVKAILGAWLIVKIIAFPVTMLTQSAADLTFINPAAELSFQSLVFIKDTSLGLGVFIGFVVILAVGFPASFLVLSEGRFQNIVGFFAYALIVLTDTVSAFILGFSEWMFILAPFLNFAMLVCLFFYGKQLFKKQPEDHAEKGDGDNAEP